MKTCKKYYLDTTIRNFKYLNKLRDQSINTRHLLIGAIVTNNELLFKKIIEDHRHQILTVSTDKTQNISYLYELIPVIIKYCSLSIFKLFTSERELLQSSIFKLQNLQLCIEYNRIDIFMYSFEKTSYSNEVYFKLIKTAITRNNKQILRFILNSLKLNFNDVTVSDFVHKIFARCIKRNLIEMVEVLVESLEIPQYDRSVIFALELGKISIAKYLVSSEKYGCTNISSLLLIGNSDFNKSLLDRIGY
jgi:hypothetical protein